MQPQLTDQKVSAISHLKSISTEKSEGTIPIFPEKSHMLAFLKLQKKE